MGRMMVFIAGFGMVLTALAGCSTGPSYVRDTDRPNIDQAAMSTGLDRKDLERLFEDNYQAFENSHIVGKWKTSSNKGEPAAVAVFPFVNQTSEHIDSQLDVLLRKFETQLVNGGFLHVVSTRQAEVTDQVRMQQTAAFDPLKATMLGKQLGAHYLITGSVADVAERTSDGRRVQYMLFMEVFDVELNTIVWKNEASLTKALVR